MAELVGANWTYETQAAKADEIVPAFRRRSEEHMTTGGWQWTAESTPGNRCVYSLRKRACSYILRLSHHIQPVPVDQGNTDPKRVYLKMRWIGVGYAQTDGALRLAYPVPAVE